MTTHKWTLLLNRRDGSRVCYARFKTPRAKVITLNFPKIPVKCPFHDEGTIVEEFGKSNGVLCPEMFGRNWDKYSKQNQERILP
jgi:hypothetical protein